MGSKSEEDDVINILIINRITYSWNVLALRIPNNQSFSCSSDPLPVDSVPCRHCWERNCADSLARVGAGETTTPAASLTYLELFSKYKAKNKAIWMVPPMYQSKYPGVSLVRVAVDEIKLRVPVSLVVICCH
ncbi:hypothetical protein TNCV_1627731 [Trichonephila clavipes]|nr:hypothetical protein TNCV_1627731 [Trichonephila clavipes]